jgi:hypothetical protein
MDSTFLRSQLIDNAARIEALVKGVTDDGARWKPDPDSWSILEVINHLYDEEREDFRVRLEIILTGQDREWPPIDPQGWVTERRYNERQLEPSLKAFLEERDRSLEWLHSLGKPNWGALYVSPFGSIRAGDMFAAWVTHDQLHLRQLVELHRLRTAELALPYSLEYAGDW